MVGVASMGDGARNVAATGEDGLKCNGVVRCAVLVIVF